MKIAFIDFISWDYSIDTVAQRPLGGSQSALCYLAIQLARLKQNVFLLNHSSEVSIQRGVVCLPLECVSADFFNKLDFIIILNSAGNGKEIKQFLEPHTQLILWSQHASDQQAVLMLKNKDEQDFYDFFILISEWQKQDYIQSFNIDSNKTIILRNAVASNFENLFNHTDSILNAKEKPITLAYTSTPFRGLDLLIDIFPRIRQAHPEIRLKIFSSMQVYQTPSQDDEAQYGLMYNYFRNMEGVDYIGSVPQSQLAEELKSISILAYPNIFAETSCIAVMEAMSSGCYIITSALGALPETTAGYGRLISLENGIEAYKSNFVIMVNEVIDEIKLNAMNRMEEHLKTQVAFCNQEYTWENRANQWLQFLYTAKIHRLFNEGDYAKVIDFCQEAMALYPKVFDYSSYLIVTLVLLDCQEEALSAIWNLNLSYSPDLSDQWLCHLSSVLEKEKLRFYSLDEQEAVQKIENFCHALE
ncbi:MAG: glycosyltransferase [Cyanobacteriota bacterium]|jgi:glycosyltransferase involved in cell wall biosynthesis